MQPYELFSKLGSGKLYSWGNQIAAFSNANDAGRFNAVFGREWTVILLFMDAKNEPACRVLYSGEHIRREVLNERQD